MHIYIIFHANSINKTKTKNKKKIVCALIYLELNDCCHICEAEEV